ncbi:hypothetical protein FRC07_008853, partial [Ceratobasidium sp. 392]
ALHQRLQLFSPLLAQPATPRPPWIWEANQQAALDYTKAEICKKPTLTHPDETEPYIPEIDASGTGMGAVLVHRQGDGGLCPVAFMSASFFPAELNYDTDDKELPTICIPTKFLDHQLKDALLYYQGRIVVPDEFELKQELLSQFHDTPAANHQNSRSEATGKPPFEIIYGRSLVFSPFVELKGLAAADDRAKELRDTIKEVKATL